MRAGRCTRSSSSSSACSSMGGAVSTGRTRGLMGMPGADEAESERPRPLLLAALLTLALEPRRTLPQSFLAPDETAFPRSTGAWLRSVSLLFYYDSLGRLSVRVHADSHHHTRAGRWCRSIATAQP